MLHILTIKLIVHGGLYLNGKPLIWKQGFPGSRSGQVTDLIFPRSVILLTEKQPSSNSTGILNEQLNIALGNKNNTNTKLFV